MVERTLVLVVWIIAIVGIKIMKKISPTDKIYPVWVIFISILFTLFVAWHESWLSILLVQ